MSDYTTDNWKFPASERVQRLQDVMLVSSFALWAMLIGFAPVVTYRLLTA
ncbi:MAG: hypothetical protein J0H42_18310 [Rhizobiales bacterium]|nr:hypothetical protein [Hyphomicrobiales bacterium]